MKRNAIALILGTLLLSACGSRTVLPTQTQMPAAATFQQQNQIQQHHMARPMMQAQTATPFQNQNNSVAQRQPSSTMSSSSHNVAFIAQRIMKQYDHNQNHQIEYQMTNHKDLIFENKNENVRVVEIKYESEKNESEKIRVAYFWKYDKLFIAADSNQDGVASLQEIQNFIGKNFDLNGDGTLQSRGLQMWKGPGEWESFKRNMFEDYGSTIERFIDPFPGA